MLCIAKHKLISRTHSSTGGAGVLPAAAGAREQAPPGCPHQARRGGRGPREGQGEVRLSFALGGHHGVTGWRTVDGNGPRKQQRSLPTPDALLQTMDGCTFVLLNSGPDNPAALCTPTTLSRPTGAQTRFTACNNQSSTAGSCPTWWSQWHALETRSHIVPHQVLRTRRIHAEHRTISAFDTNIDFGRSFEHSRMLLHASIVPGTSAMDTVANDITSSVGVTKLNQFHFTAPHPQAPAVLVSGPTQSSRSFLALLCCHYC